MILGRCFILDKDTSDILRNFKIHVLKYRLRRKFPLQFSNDRYRNSKFRFLSSYTRMYVRKNPRERSYPTIPSTFLHAKNLLKTKINLPFNISLQNVQFFYYCAKRIAKRILSKIEMIS